MDIDETHIRPSNLLYADILEFLIQNRKRAIDFTQEGYATIGTLKKRLGTGGYEEEDTLSAIKTLVEWGFVESESLVSEEITDETAVRMYATGYIHMRFFLERLEYLVGITTDMRFISRAAAEEIGRTWAGQSDQADLSRFAKRKILSRLKSYIEQEYSRRCRRHAFYEDVGVGGSVLVNALRRAWEHLNSARV